MKLRINSGELGRRFITINSRKTSFRPTLERVRQSIVDSLEYRISGAYAADFCAGSGAVGFELISRGAQMVHFVESDRLLVRSLKDHVKLFKVQERARIICDNVHHYIKSTSLKYDILFFDPPYYDLPLNALVKDLMSLVSPNGILVYQHDRKVEFECVESPGVRISSRTYGRTVVHFLEKE